MENVAIIVPYRDRKEHLDEFLKIYTDTPVFIIEQDNNEPFNRGKLLNVGFDIASTKYPLISNFIFHDVDMIPDQNHYVIHSNSITHYATIVEQFGYAMPYPNYVGGVICFNKQMFRECNGYSNQFKGWGAEDDDIYNRIKAEGFAIKSEPKRYKSLPHERNVDQVQYNINLLKLQTLKNKYKYNGLNNLKYEITEKTIINNAELIKVKI